MNHAPVQTVSIYPHFMSRISGTDVLIPLPSVPISALSNNTFGVDLQVHFTWDRSPQKDFSLMAKVILGRIQDFLKEGRGSGSSQKQARKIFPTDKPPSSPKIPYLLVRASHSARKNLSYFITLGHMWTQKGLCGAQSPPPSPKSRLS